MWGTLRLLFPSSSLLVFCLFVIFGVGGTSVVRRRVDAGGGPPPRTRLVPSMSRPGRGSSIGGTDLLAPILPACRLPKSLR